MKFRKIISLLSILLVMLLLASCNETIEVDTIYDVTYDSTLASSEAIKNAENSTVGMLNTKYHYGGVIIKKENSLKNNKYIYYVVTKYNSDSGILNRIVLPNNFETSCDFVGCDFKNGISVYSFSSNDEFKTVIKTEKSITKGTKLFSLSFPLTSKGLDSKSYDHFHTLKEGIVSRIRLGGYSTSVSMNSNEYGAAVYDTDGGFLGLALDILDVSSTQEYQDYKVLDHVVALNNIYDYDYVYEIFNDIYNAKSNITRGVIGITIMDYERQSSVTLTGNPLPAITAVEAYSPAQKANIRPGEFVYSIDGNKVVRMAEISYYLHNKNAGDKVEIGIEGTSGTRRTVEIIMV